MSLKADSEGKSYDDINVTPMVDLYLVLLLIFIIMTTAGIQGVKVNLPKASNTPSLAKPKTKAITVNNEGKVFLDTVPVSLDELATKLQAAKAQVPDLPVVIKGDSLTQYQGIMDVLNVVGNVGITQVGLATKMKDQK
jgi:biopolymer transport protein ExbD